MGYVEEDFVLGYHLGDSVELGWDFELDFHLQLDRLNQPSIIIISSSPSVSSLFCINKYGH